MSAESAPHYFVLGSGRCGSTLLSNLLRAHPQVLSLSEFFSMLGGPRAFARARLTGCDLAAFLGTLEPDLRELLPSTEIAEISYPRGQRGSYEDVPAPLLVTLPHLTSDARGLWDELERTLGEWPEAAVEQHYLELFDALRRRFARRVWVERSGGSIEYGELIRSRFPRARFVHLLRDGRACALSMAKHPLFRVRVARIVSGLPELSAAECLRIELPIDRFGAYWSALMHLTAKFVRKSHEETCLLRYEQLVAEPRLPLQRLAKFLGLEGDLEDWLQAAEAAVRPSASAQSLLSAAERAALDRACRPGLRLLEQITGSAR